MLTYNFLSRLTVDEQTKSLKSLLSIRADITKLSMGEGTIERYGKRCLLIIPAGKRIPAKTFRTVTNKQAKEWDDFLRASIFGETTIRFSDKTVNYL